MDQLTLQRIFEPWFSSRPEGSGKGLGLYISGEIINALGGTINASSIEGKGSVFTVSLPLSDTD
jgi:signal transduction histidine kinase